MTFQNNYVYAVDGIGGAITAGFNSILLLSGTVLCFINNSANYGGGVAILNFSMLNMTAEEVVFMNNSARSTAGGLGIGGSSRLRIVNADIINNSAPQGGGIHCDDSNCIIMSTNFINNTGNQEGGALFASTATTMIIHDINVTGNSGTAINVFHSIANFSGVSKVNKNKGVLGGGMNAWLSIVHFWWDHTI